MLSRCSVPRRAAALLTSEELHLASFQSSSYVVCSELRRAIGGLVRIGVRVRVRVGVKVGDRVRVRVRARARVRLGLTLTLTGGGGELERHEQGVGQQRLQVRDRVRG